MKFVNETRHPRAEMLRTGMTARSHPLFIPGTQVGNF